MKAIVQDELKKQKPLAGWKDGFYLQSQKGDFKLKFRGYIQANARWFPNDAGDTGTDSFYLRRVRPILEGTRLKYFDFKYHARLRWHRRHQHHGDHPGRVHGRQVLGLRALPRRQVQGAVQPRAPAVGRRPAVHRALDRQHLAPNRDVGFMLYGDLFDDDLQYQVGIFDGVVDGGSTDGDASSDKDVARTLLREPVRHHRREPAKGLGFGFAGTYGNDNGDPIDGTRCGPTASPRSTAWRPAPRATASTAAGRRSSTTTGDRSA